MKKETRTKRKELTFFGAPLSCIVLVAAVFSHLGWWIENISRMFLVGVFDARFYVLPFISAYAVIPFAFHGILGEPDDIKFFGKRIEIGSERVNLWLTNILAFFSMLIFVFVGELLVGNFFDAFFGVELWDYSSHPLHFTQYTGVLTGLGFAAGAFVLYKTVYKWLMKATGKIPRRTRASLAILLFTLVMLDTANMIIYTAVRGEAPMLWSVNLR